MKPKRCPLFVAVVMFVGAHPIEAQLSIAPAGNQVVISWPTTLTNYIVQSTTNLSFANWGFVSTAQGVMNGQNTVTNPISGTQQFYRLSQLTIPSGMVLIPAGTFTMGDTLDGESNAKPTNVMVSAFYMDVNLVTYSQWLSVYNWATTNGYTFHHAGAGKAGDHPVQTVNWYDTVTWCNARSQQVGQTAVYYTDAGLTQVYSNADVTNVYANWQANGYRLPTEAEWEKAARGGVSGQRFPWGNTISEIQANYNGNTATYSYDLGPNGFNAAFTNGVVPYTSPVGYFSANGYGLYDMAGNTAERCWDWYGTPYAGGIDPHGPASGSIRIVRGGYWNNYAVFARCADREATSPLQAGPAVGFRCVRGL